MSGARACLGQRSREAQRSLLKRTLAVARLACTSAASSHPPQEPHRARRPRAALRPAHPPSFTSRRATARHSSSAARHARGSRHHNVIRSTKLKLMLINLDFNIYWQRSLNEDEPGLCENPVYIAIPDL